MMKSFLGMKWKWYGIIAIYKNNLNRLVRNKKNATAYATWERSSQISPANS